MVMLRVLILSLMMILIPLQAMDENAVRTYMEKYIKEKTKGSIKKIDILSSYPVPGAESWQVNFLAMKVDIDFAGAKQDATIYQTVFTKGEKITFKLMKKGKNGSRDLEYADFLKPKVPFDAYDNAHFLMGSPNAPHKIVVFSDPFCPYCREKIPEIMEVVKANPTTYGLYYYHFPLLRIHPAADLTTKAMHIFQRRGDVKNMMALYDLFIEPEEKNTNEILKAIKEKTGVKFTLAELQSEEVVEALRIDMAMQNRLQVTGTPTIFIDGMWDKMRTDYKKYAK